MPDLLIELRSEEIPARMQRKAAGDLKKLLTDALVEAGLTYEAAREYWTPRRLALDIRGLSARSSDVHEERKGPSTSAPEGAIQGFLRGAGLTDIAQAHVHTDPKKGAFYVAHIVKPGRAAAEVIAEAMPKIIREFPWPKSMRWGAESGPKGKVYKGVAGEGSATLRWVRPLKTIICLLGSEGMEPEIVGFEVGGIASSNVTYGHRFHAPAAITVKRFDDYVTSLERAKVVLDADRRKEIILADARNTAFASGLELVEDEALLEEVSGLVEWPVVLMGAFEEEYLSIPGEVIRLTIKTNQKCFVTRGKDGNLSNKFILIANIDASDGGKEIIHGNGKVVRARLSDAVHFWKTDQANVPDLEQLKDSAAKFGLDLTKPLDQRMARLDHLNVTFHAKLGTQGERVLRIAKLAEELAVIAFPLAGKVDAQRPDGGGGETASSASTAPISAITASSAPPPSVGSADTFPARGKALAALAHRAAVLAKADLQSEMVGEFPELQGLMGRKYAAMQGEDPSVCAAIEDHWKPQGPADRVPSDPVAIAVALADKLDTLVGFWAIDEKPTGSKDPFALRRAALGVIRIVLERGVSAKLIPLITKHLNTQIVLNLFQLSNASEALEHLDAHGGEFANFLKSLSPLQRALLVSCVGRNIDERTTREEINWTSWIYVVGAFNEMRVATGRTAILDIDNQIRSHGDKELERHVARSKDFLGDCLVAISTDLLAFFHDRLKGYLREQGARHDLIDAVITPEADDLLQIARKVEALSAYINSEDGQNLVAGTKRAANILASEEKKGTKIENVIDVRLFKEPVETALFEALNDATYKAGLAVDKEDFAGAMMELSKLRAPVDAFLEGVQVNDPDLTVKANRLALLNDMKKATLRVADFSKIVG